nr:PLP-dependent transferase [Shinella lacus]
MLRDLGAAISQQNAFQFIQDLETSPLRLRQNNENAVKVAEYLKGHAKVERVIFPKFQDGTTQVFESRKRYSRRQFHA